MLIPQHNDYCSLDNRVNRKITTTMISLKNAYSYIILFLAIVNLVVIYSFVSNHFVLIYVLM